MTPRRKKKHVNRARDSNRAREHLSRTRCYVCLHQDLFRHSRGGNSQAWEFSSESGIGGELVDWRIACPCCDRFFHEFCLGNWVLNSGRRTCPMCRTVMLPFLRGVQEVPFARDGQYPLALSKAGLDFRQVEFLLEVGAQRQQQHVFLAQEDEMDRIPNLIIPYGWADFRRRQHPPHPNPVPQHNVQPG